MKKRIFNLSMVILLLIGNIYFYLSGGSEYAFDVSVFFGIAMSLLIASPLIGYIYLTIKEWDYDN